MNSKKKKKERRKKKNKINYEKIGFKAGLEVHMELNPENNRKLFCHCPAKLSQKEPDLEIIRYQKAVPGERGKTDVAAKFETLRERKIIYQAVSEDICEVELDEAPPLPPNEEAIDISLTIALLLKADPVDEIEIMRKTIVDGSLPSGFQRTSAISFDSGYVKTSKGKVKISEVLLEEDSARIIEQKDNKKIFRIDRLGIPEVEIGTRPEIKDPEHAKETALKIGQIIRSTGKAKTGLGTVRQDVNVSIKGGARTEIKHVQRLSLIPKVLKNEVKRQLALIEIKEELKKRKITIKSKKLKLKVYDVNSLFQKTKSKIIKKAIKKNKKIYAVKLKGFSGLLGKEIQPGESFGKELADILNVKIGLGGIIHTDELPKYGITQKEVKKLREKTKASQEDCIVIIVVKDKKEANKAKDILLRRLEQAVKEIPKEVRKALPDGTTKYLRPLPGAARLYPETDLLPIPITEEKVNKLKSNLPELPSQIKERLKEYKLSKKLIDELSKSEWLYTFERIVKKYDIDPTLVASTLEYTLPSLKREGVPVGKINEEGLFKTFEALQKGKITKEAIPDILVKISENPDKIDEFLSEIKPLSKKETEEKVDDLIQEKRDFVKEKGIRALKPLMGLIMSKLGNRIDGEIVSRILRKKIKEMKEES